MGCKVPIEVSLYIKKDWSVIWRANEKVLARFNWKQ